MNSLEILEAFANNPEVMAEVLHFLNDGIWDEWDCGLDLAFRMFDTEEFHVAAKSALAQAQYYFNYTDESPASYEKGE